MDLPRPDRIEDYGLIGNLHTAALVHRNGAIDWLCLPRFDGPACFARLLGENQNGYWQIAPVTTPTNITRGYEGETLILTTRFETATGIAEITDFMPLDPAHGVGQLVRIVQGIEGTVDMQTTLFLRFDYGSVVPWVRAQTDGIYAVSGSQAVRIRTRVKLEGQNMHTVGRFTITAGKRIPFVMSWHQSYYPEPRAVHPETSLRATAKWWKRWVDTYDCPQDLRAPVIRSLITLKALTHAHTGGIVAAVTTSLPERIGGVRNWDYRYCWVRDAAFTLNAFMRWGHREEIVSWKAWLLRAAAGKPEDLQIMYGISGDRRLTELELPWLKGFADSQPVRTGNAASQQRQLDVYGELIDAFSLGRRIGLQPTKDSWAMGMTILKFLETIWREPDSGLWEERGKPRHFTYSKVMAWVAFDRAIAAAESHPELRGMIEAWKKTRAEIFAEVCEKGFSKNKNSFTQSYGSDALDASLLRIPLVGFLPPDDPRVIGTVDAIQRELMSGGMVMRYKAEEAQDGLPPGEGSFIACSFWLADALIAIGRQDEGRALFERLLSMANDLGLMAEEYDPIAKRQLGNFPQAFSHVGVLHTARNLVDLG
jgi:GH15 family glucan-1,4-alpha-glucosidase